MDNGWLGDVEEGWGHLMRVRTLGRRWTLGRAEDTWGQHPSWCHLPSMGGLFEQEAPFWATA